MGEKRTKVKNGLSSFIPRTINFSEIEREKMEENPDYGDGTYNLGDNGEEVEKLEQKLQYEELVMQMLYSLEGNERLIFLYQILRDYGYQIDHESFAKTLHLKRSRYMDILGTVRLKTYLVVSGYRKCCSKQTGNK